MQRCAAPGSGSLLLIAGLVFAWSAPAAASRSIIGICPDGSMFIVKRADLIPCREAKLVEADEVPPIKGEYLPRPYAWELFHRRTDPNNPYNLIDAARQARAARGEGPFPGDSVETKPMGETPQVSSAPPPRSGRATAATRKATDLVLSEDDLRNLTLIVDLAQQRAPAAFERQRRDGSPGLVLQLARSQAFEAALVQDFAERGSSVSGPVLLFLATAAEPQAFHPNLTFVQGHVAYHPNAKDPKQLGMLRGSLARVSPEQPALGYAVLPENLDLTNPIDIYWDDQRVTATLSR
jgi:hypothetical protein